MRRAILIAASVALLSGALVAPASADPAPFEASGSFAFGGEDGGLLGGSTNVTKREFLASCAIPATQGVEGYVIQLPGALSTSGGVARVEWTLHTLYEDIFMEFYGLDCTATGRAGVHDAYGESEEVGSFPAGTSYILVSATRAVLVEFTLTATPTQSEPAPGPSMPDPSPSPNPTPSPDPSAAPAHSHPRTVSLDLRRHVVATGVVTTSDDSDECVSHVAVDIARKSRSGWSTVATVTTMSDGSFKARIPDRIGRYRAEVDSTHLDSHTCERALSMERVHSHS